MPTTSIKNGSATTVRKLEISESLSVPRSWSALQLTRLENQHSQKLKTAAMACCLLFSLAAFSQLPGLGFKYPGAPFSENDFRPPTLSLDTVFTIPKIPAMIRFPQIAKFWSINEFLDFKIYYQLPSGGKLYIYRLGKCRGFTLNLPVQYEGNYYLSMSGYGKTAKAKINVQATEHQRVFNKVCLTQRC